MPSRGARRVPERLVVGDVRSVSNRRSDGRAAPLRLPEYPRRRRRVSEEYPRRRRGVSTERSGRRRHGAFGDGIVAVTLGAGLAIRLRQNPRRSKDAEVHVLWLPPRSALVLTGAARYVYTHGITSRKGDLVDGVWKPRGRRVSLTFRRLPAPGPCPCGFPESCDAVAGAPRFLPTRLRPQEGSLEPRGADAPD